MMVTYDFAGYLLTYELRIWTPYRMEGYENGNAFYGTNGFLLLGKNDNFKLYGHRNELIEETPADGTNTENTLIHHADFVNSIRAGTRPQADIEFGHHSAVACHLGNIAARVGRGFEFDATNERIVSSSPSFVKESRCWICVATAEASQ